MSTKSLSFSSVSRSLLAALSIVLAFAGTTASAQYNAGAEPPPELIRQVEYGPLLQPMAEFPDGLIGLSSGSDDLYTIDPATGAATLLVATNGNPNFTGLSFLGGTLYATDLNGFPGSVSPFDIGSIDTSGVITFLSDQNGSVDWHGLASGEAEGKLWSIDIQFGNDLVEQFPDGTVNVVGPTGIQGRGMAYDDGNGILYATGPDFGPQSLYTVDTSTGASTLVGPTGVESFLNGLAFDECTGTLYMVATQPGPGTGPSFLFTVDTTTGAATQIGPTGFATVDGLAWKGECDPLKKELTSGPDRDGDDAVDLVVPVGELVPTAYDFTISWHDPENPNVAIEDRVPAEWDVTHIEFDDTADDGTLLPIGCGGDVDFTGDYGMVDLFRGGKPGKKCNSDTGLLWMPDSGGATVLYGAAHQGGPANPSTLFTIDSATGAATPVGPIGFDHVTGLDFGPDGVLYGIGRRPGDGQPSLISIDTITGFGTEIGPTFVANFDVRFDISFRNGDGQLFGTGFGTNCVGLGTVDTLIGAALEIGPTATCAPGNGVAFSVGDTLYHFDVAGGGSFYTLNQATGVATFVSAASFAGFPTLSNPRINAMEFHPGTDTLFAAVNDGSIGSGPNYLATVDTATGVVNHIGLSTNGLASLAFGEGADNTLNVQTLARCHDNKKNKKCRPTSCGALYLNYGAVAYDKATGELVAGPTDPICLAAVEDLDGDGTFTWDGTGDEDGDGLTDFFEACEFPTYVCDPDSDDDGVLDGIEVASGCMDPLDSDTDGDGLGDGVEDANQNGVVDPGETDPCNPDTDGDGVIDSFDACPLEGPPDPTLGQILGPDGCIFQSQCSDGIDNDSDGPIDYPDDASCDDILDDSEDTPDPTGITPGDTSTVVSATGIDGTGTIDFRCIEWSGDVCTRPQARVPSSTCGLYLDADIWHDMTYFNSPEQRICPSFCQAVTGDDTHITCAGGAPPTPTSLGNVATGYSSGSTGCLNNSDYRWRIGGSFQTGSLNIRFNTYGSSTNRLHVQCNW